MILTQIVLSPGLIVGFTVLTGVTPLAHTGATSCQQERRAFLECTVLKSLTE